MSLPNSLQQNVGLGGLGNWSPYYPLCPIPDRRPARVQLEERLHRNEDLMKALQTANDDLRVALAELDANPVIERISDLLRRLLS